MHISGVNLRNFRSYEDYSFELEPGINIVVGPNASGKTNLLESLYVLSRGHSFRVADKELIQNGKTWFRVDGRVNGNQRSIKYQPDKKPPHKSLEIDEVVYKRLKPELLLPVTLFEPDHLRLLAGSPERRRNYLDDVIDQLEPQFHAARTKYQRALLQRNRLLKSRPTSLNDQLFVWDLKLSELGALISTKRQELISQISKKISRDYSTVAGHKTKIGITYQPSIQSTDYASSILKALSSNLQRDLERGFTSVGPHREDFEVTIDGAPSSITASRGEMRTAILVLKIIELKMLEDKHQQKPLLLLDDVFSELDGARRRALTKYLADYQTVITTTDADAIIEHFLEKEYKIIPTQT